MLNVLERALKALPELIQDYSIWKSLYVDYHAPFVERAYTTFEKDYRVMLHKIYPCESSEALFHPHPWPSAMLICNGSYEMKIGNFDFITSTMILSAGSKYEMTDPKSWHSVWPLGKPSYSIMVTGRPWQTTINTKPDKKLEPLNDAQFQSLMANFSDYFKTGFMGDTIDSVIDQTLNDGQLRFELAQAFARSLKGKV